MKAGKIEFEVFWDHHEAKWRCRVVITVKGGGSGLGADVRLKLHY